MSRKTSPRNARFFGDDKGTSPRTPAQRDRDRILYASAFRRLANVTQVVAADHGYVFHNRLTHTLKVAQIGRRLAEKINSKARTRKLAQNLGGLDPDVVEAAGLAHDLGHPPFGHLAEKFWTLLLSNKGSQGVTRVTPNPFESSRGWRCESTRKRNGV